MWVTGKANKGKISFKVEQRRNHCNLLKLIEKEYSCPVGIDLQVGLSKFNSASSNLCTQDLSPGDGQVRVIMFFLGS